MGISAFEAYKDYVALKQHFSKSNYDFFRYNGKTGLTYSSYEKRKDKIFFEKLAKRPDYRDFLVSNISINPKIWIKQLSYSETADKVFQDWKKRQQSLTYNFKSDLIKIKDESKDHHHPAAIRLFLANEISLESLCLFATITGALKRWDERLIYDPIWEDIKFRIVKYTPFIKYEKDKIRKIVLDLNSD